MLDFVKFVNTEFANKKSLFDVYSSEIIINHSLIENIWFNQKGLTKSILILLNLSKLHCFDFNITNIKNFSSTHFIKSQNSEMIFRKTRIENILFYNEFIFIEAITNDNKVILISIIFEEFIAGNISSDSTFRFLVMKQFSSQIIIRNCSFKNIISNDDIILILKFSQFTSIENTIFKKNFVKSNIFSYGSQFIRMKNISCIGNNIQGEKFYSGKGNCFKLYEASSIQIDLIKIIQCFSLNLPILMINIIYNNINGMEGSIIINKGFFFRNQIKCNEQADNGGVLRINIKFTKLIMQKSYFSQNTLEMNEVALNNGPCMRITSDNIVEIARSTFNKNKASKSSNCIYCSCNILNITTCSFINNSLTFLSERDYQFLNETRNYGLEYFNVQDSKGGAIFFTGNILLIFNSLFFANKANLGSAIYLENYNKAIFYIENSIFYKNQALWSSTIGFNVLNPLECFLKRTLFLQNFAYEGGVMLFKLLQKVLLNLVSNYFLGNVANLAPVIYLDIGPLMITSTNNTFRQNLLKSTISKVGGTAYLINSGATAYLENENYIENYCYQGINTFFGSKGYEVNSIYIGNKCLFVSGVATSHANYFGLKIYFMNSQAEIFGCVTSADTSEIFLENIYFFNLSSYHRGACIFIQEYSKISVVNSYFILNAKNSINSINSIEIETSIESSIFKGCIFTYNSIKSKFFDLTFSNIFIQDSIFINCTGNTFFLIQNSNLKLIRVGFQNIASDEDDILFISESTLNSSFIYFNLITTNEKSGSIFFLDFSQIWFENCILKNIKAQKEGSIINAISSSIIMQRLSCANYLGANSFYLYFCFLNLKDSFFKNENQIYSEGKGNLAFIFASRSELLTIENCFFLGNKDQNYNARFIYISRNQNPIKIYRTYFNSGFSFSNGGAILIEYSNAVLEYCYFKNNKAKMGGSISSLIPRGIEKNYKKIK